MQEGEKKRKKMDKPDFLGKRKFPRADVISFVVIKCIVTMNIKNKEQREFHTHTENLCKTGINVILDKKLHRSDKVEVKLYLTGKLVPIKCQGWIAWSKLISPEGTKPSLFSTGIKLIRLKNDDRDDIDKVVSCFVNKST